jgi:hypothetical protein
VSFLKVESRLPSRAVKWLMIAGVWTLTALFFTGETLMRSHAAGRPLSQLSALGWELFSCYLWLAFLPFITVSRRPRRLML